MFEGFTRRAVPVADGVHIHARIGGRGPALLLLHGHPQTHVMWHKVVPTLAEHYTIVAADLRGYGDSSRPAAGPDSDGYSKRTMAADMVAVMKALGHERFLLGAHDRGARLGHRLAIDHPGVVRRAVFLDIAPTLAMYEGTNEAFARAYWHWFFLIQPAPMPERAIEVNPAAWLRDTMGNRYAGLGVFAPEAYAEYERCFSKPGSAGAVCADYRSSAGIDLVRDRADREAGRKISAPLHVLWGGRGAVGPNFDVLGLWRQVAEKVTGRALDCGHYLAEEKPDETAAEMLAFFRAADD